MGSIKAQKMAMEVSEVIKAKTLVGDKRPTYEKIALKVGYSPSSAKRSTQITRTKAYKAALIAENAPLIEGLQQEINRIKSAMARKNLDHEEYRVLTGSLDVLTRNYQLLSGGATERQVFVLPSEVMARNQIQASQDTPKLEDGSTKP